MKLLIDTNCWSASPYRSFTQALLKRSDLTIAFFGDAESLGDALGDMQTSKIVSQVDDAYDFYLSNRALPEALVHNDDIVTIALAFDLFDRAEEACAAEKVRYWRSYDYTVGLFDYTAFEAYRRMFQLDSRKFRSLLDAAPAVGASTDDLLSLETQYQKRLQAGDGTDAFVAWLASIVALRSETPLVSIVTITYNLVKNERVESIKRCIESIHNQTYEQIEHMIIDGASTDGTLELLADYQHRGWLRLLSEPDNGVYDAMNKGVRAANGKYIVFMNSDDCYCDSQAVARAVQMMECRQADYAYGNAQCTRKDGTTIVWGANLQMLPFATNYCHQTLFVKTEIMRHFGGFQTEYKVSADSQVMLRLYADGYKACQINASYVSYQLGGLSSTSEEIGRVDHGTAFFRLMGRRLGCTLDECLELSHLRFLNDYTLAHQLDLVRRLGGAFDTETISVMLMQRYAALHAAPIRPLRELLKKLGHMHSKIVCSDGQHYRIYYILKWIPVRKIRVQI